MTCSIQPIHLSQIVHHPPFSEEQLVSLQRMRALRFTKGAASTLRSSDNTIRPPVVGVGGAPKCCASVFQAKQTDGMKFFTDQLLQIHMQLLGFNLKVRCRQELLSLLAVYLSAIITSFVVVLTIQRIRVVFRNEVSLHAFAWAM